MMREDEASRFRELLAAERRSADLYDGGIVKLFGNGCGAVDVSGLGGER
jgi:hypothetical protein